MSENCMGYVVGIRSMNIFPKNPSFLTGGANVEWYSPRQKARCTEDTEYFPHDPPPHDQNIQPFLDEELIRPKCGINMYSLNSHHWANTFRHTFGKEDFALTYVGKVFALTKGWGKVAIHADGYRVQQALITHLLIDPRIFKYKPPDVDFLPGFFKRGTKMVYDVDEFKDIISQHPNSLTPIPEKEVT